MPEKELTEAEKAEIERMNAIKDKRHEQYLARKARESQQKWEKAYEPRRKARIAQLKADNPSTYGIHAEEYDQEHYSKVIRGAYRRIWTWIFKRNTSKCQKILSNIPG